MQDLCTLGPLEGRLSVSENIASHCNQYAVRLSQVNHTTSHSARCPMKSLTYCVAAHIGKLECEYVLTKPDVE